MAWPRVDRQALEASVAFSKRTVYWEILQESKGKSSWAEQLASEPWRGRFAAPPGPVGLGAMLSHFLLDSRAPALPPGPTSR